MFSEWSVEIKFLLKYSYISGNITIELSKDNKIIEIKKILKQTDKQKEKKSVKQLFSAVLGEQLK